MESAEAVWNEKRGVSVARSTSSRSVSRRHTPKGRLISAATLLAGVAIAVGWWGRDDRNIVPDEGSGLALGIAGLACMVALLLYSVRKRARALRRAGRVSAWFQIHMLLGLAGPVAILYHCNFRLGSLNSNVALACALVVAASGVIGRLIYTRIHHGLSNRRTTLEEVTGEIDSARRAIGTDDRLRELWEVFEGFESQAVHRRHNPVQAVWSFVTLGHRCRSARRRALRCLREAAASDSRLAANQEELRSHVRRYVSAVRQTETLGVYARVFALWHVLHLPLTFLLYVSAMVHVVAVNMY